MKWISGGKGEEKDMKEEERKREKERGKERERNGESLFFGKSVFFLFVEQEDGANRKQKRRGEN